MIKIQLRNQLLKDRTQAFNNKNSKQIKICVNLVRKQQGIIL